MQWTTKFRLYIFFNKRKPGANKRIGPTIALRQNILAAKHPCGKTSLWQSKNGLRSAAGLTVSNMTGHGNEDDDLGPRKCPNPTMMRRTNALIHASESLAD